MSELTIKDEMAAAGKEGLTAHEALVLATYFKENADRLPAIGPVGMRAIQKFSAKGPPPETEE